MEVVRPYVLAQEAVQALLLLWAKHVSTLIRSDLLYHLPVNDTTIHSIAVSMPMTSAAASEVISTGSRSSRTSGVQGAQSKTRLPPLGIQ